MGHEIMFPALQRRLRRARVGLAFSERYLVLARQGQRLRSVALPQGLIEPSAVTSNIKAVAELGQLAVSLFDAGDRPSELAVVLPDLSVTTAVIPRAARFRKRQLRDELTTRLAYHESEARVDFWRGARGEVLAAAVRGLVARQYEQVVDAVGLRLGWMDAATLASVPLWARASTDESATSVRLELYGSHYSLAVFRGGELVDLRFKLRPPGDVGSVADEICRLPSTYGGPIGSLAVSGEGASELARLLPTDVRVRSVTPEESGEEELLGRAASALTTRKR